MGIELERLAKSLEPAPAQRSKAPPPVKPVSGSAPATDEPQDTDSSEDWQRKRAAQLAAKRGRRVA
jgi:hypothetical protein